ncbi:FtsX-like permease family protein [Culturomica massiliensis]|uniref:FtsX-like permease family protein n=1 Tax=Culturomica massiliensis TaxID=1841857 RepID=UPI00266FD733|nr:FtsX-like permease family protein [Culturomica massiliensis]
MWTSLKELIWEKRNRPFTFIVNVAGLILAFTAVIVMYTHLIGEWNHDADVEHRKDIVRVEMSWGLTGGAYAPWLGDVMPEVEQYCRIFLDNNAAVHVPAQQETEEVFIREKVFLVDSTYASFFSLRMVRGDSTYRPDGVLLSESAAKQLFGESDPIGKTLILRHNIPLTVQALFKDIKNPGIRSPRILGMLETANRLFGSKMTEEWDFANFETYLRLKPGTDRIQFTGKFKQLYAAKLKEIGYKEDQISQSVNQDLIRNYTDIYFDNEVLGFADHGNYNDLRILMMLTILVLGISIINYVNIATAKVAEKSRTIGMKRILGAGRTSLIAFLVFDSVFTCFIAMGAAWALAQGLAFFLQQWIGLGDMSQLTFWSALVLWVAVPLLCGLLSGIFPAFYLTRLNRFDTMNSQRNESLALQRFKSGLMILQFAVSMGLIISTLFIYKQVNYMKHFDTGYDRKNIVVVHGNREQVLYSKYPGFRTALLQNPAVLKVGASKDPIYNIRERGFHLDVSGWDNKGAAYVTWVDVPFLDLMGLKILEGEGFHEADQVIKDIGWSINQKFIINQRMAKEIASLAPEQNYLGGNRIGVVKDFNFRSMHEPVSPMYLGLLGGFNSQIDVYIRIAPENREKALQYIESCYREFYPGTLYQYSFMEDDYARLYGSEDVFALKLLFFSVLSVVIACLGLLAFVVFFIEQKTKSIGLRRVMGATEFQIMGLLNRNFLIRLLAGFVLVCPVAYFVVLRWLSDFAYKTELSWWVFAGAFILMFVIALLCVSMLTWKAATANPVNSLKNG